MADDEFETSDNTGYKAPKQATLEEMKNKDNDDEALNRWKASLLKSAEASKTSDPRRVIVLALILEVKDRPDVVIELDTPEKVVKSKSTTFIIKEGADYRMKVRFKVQHEIVTGLKYKQVVKRAGIPVDKTEEMIGSYGPQVEPYHKAFLPEQAPSGMMARGHYTAKSRFEDDDKNVYLEWEWAFDIKKDWE